MKKASVVILYNKTIDQSATLDSLKTNFDGPVYIWDNSTSENILNTNQEQASKNGFYYFTQGENIGLARSYNYLISQIKKAQQVEYILVFDDDTIIPPEYFEEIEKLPFDSHTVYAPIIKVNDKVVNPHYHHKNELFSTLNKYRYKTVEDVSSLIGTDKIAAINSGMIVPLEVYNHVHYNEDLFVDCIDYDFCDQLHEQGIQIKILPAEVKQNFSVNEGAINLAALENRIKIRLKDTKVYSGNYYFINKITIILMYFLKTKNFKVFKYLLKGNYEEYSDNNRTV